jgi:hypothetical protein
MDRVNYVINNLPRVLNDDGGFGEKPSDDVIKNTIKFFDTVPTYYKKILDPEDCITATSYGTITIDWYFKKNFISVEIGNTKIGWFSELPDGSNSSSNGILIQDSPPADIIKSLDNIYNRKEFIK